MGQEQDVAREPVDFSGEVDEFGFMDTGVLHDERICAECGDDLAAQGMNVCTECAEKLSSGKGK